MQGQALEAGTHPAPHPAPAALGYRHLDAGLNNQKLALFGLFLLACERRVPVVLPDFSVLDPGRAVFGRTPLGAVFPEEEIYRFANAWGIEVLAAPPIDTIDGWDCFSAGASRLVADGSRGMTALDDVAAQFFRRMLPRLGHSEAWRKLSAAVFGDQAIPLVVHLRVEKDWARFSAATLAPVLDPSEEYHPTVLQIMRKISNGLGKDADCAYVVCDEDDLPVSKDEIRATVMADCGIRLVWKSDVLSEAELAPPSAVLRRRSLDFEMALRAPVFVGLSRSTFSNDGQLRSAMCRTGESRAAALHL